MKSTTISNAFSRLLWVLAVAGLILNMAAFAESNPLGGNCGDDCTNECDSSCADRGYCLNCAVTSPLAVTLAFDHSPFDVEPSPTPWVIILAVKQTHSFDIDHPPQILS
jgi:hypothetical protein